MLVVLRTDCSVTMGVNSTTKKWRTWLKLQHWSEAHSSWSNGLLERRNQTLTEILMKVKRDNGCDWRTALGWALMTKNSMCMAIVPTSSCSGRTRICLQFSLEGTCVSTWIAQHITALHAARRAFTEGIRWASHKRLWPIDDQYKTGDEVYSKQVDWTEWKGPRMVIGQGDICEAWGHLHTRTSLQASKARWPTTSDRTISWRGLKIVPRYQNLGCHQMMNPNEPPHIPIQAGGGESQPIWRIKDAHNQLVKALSFRNVLHSSHPSLESCFSSWTWRTQQLQLRCNGGCTVCT